MSSPASAEPFDHELVESLPRANAPHWLPSLLRAGVTHESTGLRILFAVAAALHLAVVLGSPRPFGYVYDFYPTAVAYVYDHHALPPPEACWICAHPPLLWIVGSPFYALGMWLSGGSRAVAERALCLLPLLCDAVVIASCYRLLRLYRRRGLALWIGMALCALLPCLAISACAPESDVLLTALMTAGLVHICRVDVLDRSRVRDALVIGALTGLAMLTKYSGVLLLVAAVVVYAARAWRARKLAPLRHAWIAACCAVAICGAQYGYNWVSRHELLVANGSARSGFAVLDLRERLANLAHYEFGTLRIREAAALFDPQVPGTLDEQPVYASVWTSLHAMAWTDMSIFSVHSRHGDPTLPYPDKRVHRGLVTWLLTLGLWPGALALLGLWCGRRESSRWPLIAFGAATFATYAWWFLAQDSWALKTKYILFLLPVYALLATDGLAWLMRLPGRAGSAAALVALAGLGSLFLCAACYIATFAIG